MHYSAICFLCLYFCLLSVFLFFWLLLFCLCLPGCFSVSLPVFPCVFFSSCLSLCLDALSNFLLPLCTSLPQVLSVCWYVFRLYVFRYVFRQTVVLTVGLHPAFFLSVSLLPLNHSQQVLWHPSEFPCFPALSSSFCFSKSTVYNGLLQTRIRIIYLIGYNCLWKSLSHVWLFLTPWTVSLPGYSVEFSRPEYWHG